MSVKQPLAQGWSSAPFRPPKPRATTSTKPISPAIEIRIALILGPPGEESEFLPTKLLDHDGPAHASVAGSSRPISRAKWPGAQRIMNHSNGPGNQRSDARIAHAVGVGARNPHRRSSPRRIPRATRSTGSPCEAWSTRPSPRAEARKPVRMRPGQAAQT